MRALWLFALLAGGLAGEAVATHHETAAILPTTARCDLGTATKLPRPDPPELTPRAMRSHRGHSPGTRQRRRRLRARRTGRHGA